MLLLVLVDACVSCHGLDGYTLVRFEYFFYSTYYSTIAHFVFLARLLALDEWLLSIVTICMYLICWLNNNHDDGLLSIWSVLLV